MCVDLIDLKIDYAFKLVFGREGQEPLLVAFLNAILKPPAGKQIQSLTYKNNELGKDYEEDKKSSLDIRVVTEDQRHINIEIQLEDEHNMAERSLYYWAQLFSRQLVEGMAYGELNPTITINILDFNYLKETDQFHCTFCLYEEQERFLLTDAIALHFIELPKLRKKWKAKEVTPQEDRLVRWLFLLDGNQDEEIRKQLEAIAMEDPMIDRAMKDWERVSADPQLRELYFDRRKAVLDRLAAVREAELREQRAEVRGREKGIAEGEARGKTFMAQDAICKYLAARFGKTSEALQGTVRSVTDLETLNRITDRVFVSSTLEEAEQVVRGSLFS